ncbi:hypothetical protein CWC18_08280 [Pseudoalteromonas aurantia]|nr:ankyrin repeat domain-containing protein [Pseudoalteromonas aurantia]TMO63507.1 hypothetical protein CWC18_08280 [Pseudoalteromonas aurantia]
MKKFIHLKILVVIFLVGCSDNMNTEGYYFDSNIQAVKTALESQVDIDIELDNGLTPLASAVKNSQPKIVKLLLSYGANPNLKLSSGGSALSLSIGLNTPEILNILLEKGGDSNIIHNGRNRALIFEVLGSQKIEHLKALLKYNPNLNVVDDTGASPLIYAASIFQYDAALILLRNGADPFIEDKYGLTLKKVIKENIRLNPNSIPNSLVEIKKIINM